MRSWVQRHNLLAARDDGALPDLTIMRDGDDVLVQWEADPVSPTPIRIRFVGQGKLRVTAAVRLTLAAIPRIQAAREAGRRAQCQDDVTCISVFGLHHATCPPCRREMVHRVANQALPSVTAKDKTSLPNCPARNSKCC